MRELSICIPARNEEWLRKTVEDILSNIEADTEVLVGCDGNWPDGGIPDDPRVRMIYVSEPIGQRAMQNRLVRLSTAKYVAKCDAHCAFDKGFDKKMIEAFKESGDDVTMVPVMRNLHVFDWVCQFCGAIIYQGPEPGKDPSPHPHCPECQSNDWKREIVWNAKNNPQSSAYRFNKNLQFKYFPELRAKLPKEGLQESMSLQGSFFMCTRENYWGKNLCDESWGSWGQQGTEVALKTWLSGGRVLVNFNTWYGHLFRTQQGFGWPYEVTGQNQARKKSHEIFLNDAWEQAIHPLNWLLDKFWFALKDVQDQEARWEESDLSAERKSASNKEIIYYTAHQKPVKLARRVQEQLKMISDKLNIPILSVSLKPMDKMGRNIHLPLEPGVLSYFTQVITALRHSDAEIVFLCEDDVLYHESNFNFIPPDDNFYFNQNWWRVRMDGLAVHWDANQVSGLVARREPLLAWYRQKYDEILKKGFDRSFEPGGRDENVQKPYSSEFPNIDFRVGGTMTKDKWSLDDFRDKSTAKGFTESTIDKIPGWDYDMIKKVLEK